MAAFQVALTRALASINPWFMSTAWGWPSAESIHFVGLSLLIGTIAVFDLRLLGVAKRVPIAAFHRLIPWGLLGFGINAFSGLMFLMTQPDQYIYNPAFHFKMFFMGVAGLNASAFYFTAYRGISKPGASLEAPRIAKTIAGVSLCCWIAIIVCGRLLTFYRPGPCDAAGPPFLADCIPR